MSAIYGYRGLHLRCGVAGSELRFLHRRGGEAWGHWCRTYGIP